MKLIRRRDNGDCWKAYVAKLAADAALQEPKDAEVRRFDKKVSNAAGSRPATRTAASPR